MVQNGAIIDRRQGGDLALHDGGAIERAVANDGMAVQRVQTTYATAMAVQKPRVLAKVEQSLLNEANLAGESFFYGWAAGQDRIEGPSVDLAMAAFRAWGNCAIEMQPVQETPTAWIFTTTFVDIESGVSIPRQFRQSKQWKVYGKLDEERKADVRFQIGQSKAIRNVILNALPKWLITKAMEQAQDGVRSKLQAYIEKNGVAAAVGTILKGLAKHGVDEARVLQKAGVAKREALDIDKLVMLRGDLAALDDGREFPAELFPPADGKDDANKSLADKINEGTKQAEQKAVVADDESHDTGNADQDKSESPTREFANFEQFQIAVQEYGESREVPAETIKGLLTWCKLNTDANKVGKAAKGARLSIYNDIINGKPVNGVTF